MKPIPIISTLIAGILSIYIAARPVKQDILFFTWVFSVPFYCTCILTIVYFIITIKYKKPTPLLSFLTGIICILITMLQNNKWEQLEKLPNYFSAHTYQIGGDGGSYLKFKNNGWVNVERQDHGALTNYWGKYYQHQDTIELDIPDDFPLEKKAIIRRDSLYAGKITFEIIR